MMKNKQNNEVYILGSESGKKRNRITKKVGIILSVIFLMIIAGTLFFFLTKKEKTPDYYFEPEQTTLQSISVTATDSIKNTGENPYIEISEESANDVPLLIYTPRHATMTLMVGMPDESDSTIVFAAMAADIRKDNMEIVGDFVLSGKRLARGVAKKGFAAIIDDKITIGLGESTPLLQQTIDQNGSFFRQYPLVYNGELIENNPKNKSIRRALAIRNEQILIIESQNKESFHDFSQALIDIGISDAIYLVGGDAYGWFYNKEHVRHEIGKRLMDIPENISYIIWQ